jgi:phosphoenolpyruvate carboxylase
MNSQSTTVQQNRIYYRTTDEPSKKLLGILNRGACLGYFQLECCDKKKPPRVVQFYPTMYIVGSPKLLVGVEAFEYAQTLVAHKQQQGKMAQAMNTAYQTKLLELRQKFSTKDDLLGFSSQEMSSSSDSYSLVAHDGHLPQNYQSNKTQDEDSIITPEIATKMSADEQAQRVKMMDAERIKQDGYFNNTWQADRELKMRQFTASTQPQQFVQSNGFNTQ